MLTTESSPWKEFIGATWSVPYAKLKRFFALAEREYIKPVIGQAQYSTLVAAMGSHTTEQAALYELCIEAACEYAIAEGASTLAMQLRDKGFIVKDSTGNDGERVASESRIKAETFNRRRRGDAAIEAIIGFLESSLTAFADYRDSAERTARRSLFVDNATIMAQWTDIGQPPSRYLYQRAIHALRNAQEQNVKTIIGPTAYADLLAKHQANTAISTEDAASIADIQKASAQLAWAEILPSIYAIASQYGVGIPPEANPELVKTTIVKFQSEATRTINGMSGINVDTNPEEETTTPTEPTGGNVTRIKKGFTWAG